MRKAVGDDPDRVRHQTYVITLNRLTGAYYVLRDGFDVGLADSFRQAKQLIEQRRWYDAVEPG